MPNSISPYFALTEKGNLVHVSEYNDEYPNAEVKALHTIKGRHQYYFAGDVKVVPKWKIGRFTAVSEEVAKNFLTIKLGA